ncbi:hypothetical protein bcere0019_11280 [Bacillus cereus Rock3-28]|nr:hypothetical protein bcere0019_11280 [Bacillus cereus Rock3-28]
MNIELVHVKGVATSDEFFRFLNLLNKTHFYFISTIEQKY